MKRLMTKKNKSDDFIDFLKRRLKSELPGKKAHLGMAPLLGEVPFRSFTPSVKTHKSSVLVLLFPGNENGDLSLIFTLRSQKLNSHSGQISFPGGHAEDGESAVETALRESSEEIALNPNGIEILGTLSPLYVPPSDAMITPVAAFLNGKPDIRVNSPDEVEEVFFVPVKIFLEKDIFKIEKWNFQNIEIDVPFWNVHPKTPLWGATSMILNELLTLFREFQGNGNL